MRHRAALPLPLMDFLDFQRTRQSTSQGELRYLDGELFIEGRSAGGYLLIIGSENYCSSDLESLERILYFYACGESYFGDELQQREILRDNAIHLCKKLDPKGTYSDLDHVESGVPPMGFNEALRQIIILTSSES